MRNYILSEETALIINSEVYYLVREKEKTTNDVCSKCYLYDSCWNDGSITRYKDLCIPSDGDEGWFFVSSCLLTEYEAKKLVGLINESFIK